MYVATYRSSVGATGDGLDAAALCAAAALTVWYDTCTHQKWDEDEEIRWRVTTCVLQQLYERKQ